MKIPKPQEGEYAPYTIMYIKLVPDDGEVLHHLEENSKAFADLMQSFSKEKLANRWAEGEWTIKEIIGHVIDTERIFGYRALRIARHDATELPGFDQDEYVPYSRANERGLEDLLEEYRAVRSSTLALFRSLDDATFTRAGKASGNPLSVRAALYIIAGHELHHMNSIKENYGGG